MTTASFPDTTAVPRVCTLCNHFNLFDLDRLRCLSWWGQADRNDCMPFKKQFIFQCPILWQGHPIQMFNGGRGEIQIVIYLVDACYHDSNNDALQKSFSHSEIHIFFHILAQVQFFVKSGTRQIEKPGTWCCFYKADIKWGQNDYFFYWTPMLLQSIHPSNPQQMAWQSNWSQLVIKIGKEGK